MYRSHLALGPAVALAVCAGSLNSASARPVTQGATPGHRPVMATPVFVPVTVASLRHEIAARKGKLVVVNFWATWCLPCQAEFPALLQAQKKYAARGVSLLFVSMDTQGDARSKGGPMLRRLKALAPMRIVKGNPLDFAKAFDPHAGAFALPRFYIYARNGKLVKSFANPDASDDTQKNLRDFDRALKPWL